MCLGIKSILEDSTPHYLLPLPGGGVFMYVLENKGVEVTQMPTNIVRYLAEFSV